MIVHEKQIQCCYESRFFFSQRSSRTAIYVAIHDFWSGSLILCADIEN
jgi:hypothetical protein